MVHSGTCEYPDETFNPDQLAVLQAEPMLVVEIVSDDVAAKKNAKNNNAKA